MKRPWLFLLVFVVCTAASWSAALFFARSNATPSLPAPELAGAGYGGTSILGCQDTGFRSKACEFQIDPVTVASGTIRAIWGLPIPAPVNGEQLQLMVNLNQGALDGCAGAACNGWVVRRLFCTWESGTCKDALLDASDLQVDSQPVVIIGDASSSVGADSGAGTLTISYGCPPAGVACSVGGSVSVNRILPQTGGGSSSGGSSSGGSSSGSSSGGSPPPTLSGFATTAPSFGSAAGQTYPVTGCGVSGGSSCAPVLNGTNLTGATVTIGGTSIPGGDMTIASGSITFNTIPTLTAGIFESACVTTSGGGPVCYGNGTSTGFTVLPGGYHAYVADFVTFGSGSSIATFTDLGDLTANTPTQGTAGNQYTQVTGGSGINGHAAASVAHSSDAYPMSSIASFTQGHAFFVASEVVGASSFNCFANFGTSTGGSLIYNATYVDDFGATSNWAFVNGLTSPITATTFGSPFIYETHMTSGGSAQIVVNGSPQNSPATGNTVGFASSPILGAGCNTYATSTIGNLDGIAFLFNSSLSSGNSQIVGQYLESWYAISGAY